MKILFVSPAIEEKSRGIGAIFRSLVESAKKDGHDVYLLLGYPQNQPFVRSQSISDKLEHLYAQHYISDGQASFKAISKRGHVKTGLLEGILSLSVFRSKSIDVNKKYLKGPKTILNDADHIIKSPYFFLLLNYLPAFMGQVIINKIVRKHDIDLVVVSAPSTLSNKKTPAQVAHFVHDTMPLELVEAPPDNNTPRRYAKQFFSTCKNSDLIFTNSQDTAKHVVETNPDANVHVLYGTASSRREDLEPGKILKRKKLTPKKYLLFTSTVEKRKNVSTLLRAYSLIHEEIDMPLVIVGAQGYGYDDIIKTYKSLDTEVQRKVKFLGYVSEADKFQLFDNAFAFVFPSVYEGMGLMLIEAMQAKIPIITSNRGALPEAGGDAAYYIEDPYDIEEISRAILKIKTDPVLVKKLVKNGIKQQKKFTFEKFTERFSLALKSISSKPQNDDKPKQSFMISAMHQVVNLNMSEIIIVGAIFLNQFNYWPTHSFSNFGGFSLEISMLSGLIIVARGLYLYRYKLIIKLSKIPQFGFIHLFMAYGLTLGIARSNSPSTVLVKGLYLLSIILAAHIVGVMIKDKKINFSNILKGWVMAALIMVPIFLVQYIAVSLGFDIFSKRAYQVGIFAFPRLHGFSFEPLFLANWLLVPAIYSSIKYRLNREVSYFLSLLLFLSLARGAIYAFLITLLLYIFISRGGIKHFKFLFKPILYAFMTTLIIVGVSSQINDSTVLQGSFRYFDHLTLGVFNSQGANNVSYTEVQTESGAKLIINTKQIDKTGAVEASTVGREQSIRFGLEFFGDEPITGSGLFRIGETSQIKYPELYNDNGFVTNSQPVDLLAETGLIGAGILLLLAVSSYRLFKIRSLVSLIFIGLIIQYLFFTNLFLIPVWVVFAALMSGIFTKELSYE